MAGVSVREMTLKFEKLEKFEGIDFKRWQKKMHFLFTTLNVAYVLSMPMRTVPEDAENESLEETRKQPKWEKDDYICHGHILNGMSDSLFDVYQNFKSTKELWDALESKYMAEDASSKKFLVNNFNNYKMSDCRPMDESILVSSIIDKLPPSWKDFKHMLKHKKEELSLVQLGSHLRIEESLRAQEGGKPKKEVGTSSINMMEESGGSKKHKGKKRFLNNITNGGSNKRLKSDNNKMGQNHLGKVSKDPRPIFSSRSDFWF
ncbi:hypothetical protein EUTSA_v10027475mg [Eutrema salsugineum]|uniref:Zinc finger, CCHC-type n=1 Tax=Eutrema salsugineum TaxID=72664 RepID=V4MRG2_EUTSA|nr:hypothetical protein EUTSA_v10027475mg [Eutrema salsugineum]